MHPCQIHNLQAFVMKRRVKPAILKTQAIALNVTLTIL